MSSSNDIRKTIQLLEKIQQGRTLHEGFDVNPLNINVGGKTIKQVIDDTTADMTPQDKLNWWAEFLAPFMEGFELVELAKHLFSKHNNQENLEENDNFLHDQFSSMSFEEKVQAVTTAIEAASNNHGEIREIAQEIVRDPVGAILGMAAEHFNGSH